MENRNQEVKQNKGVALSLPVEINIGNNSILKEKLEKIIEKGYEKTVIDLSKVEKADLSSIQILLSFVRHVHDKGEGISVDFAGPLKNSFNRMLEECGFIRKNISGEVFIFPFIDSKGVKLGYR